MLIVSMLATPLLVGCGSSNDTTPRGATAVTTNTPSPISVAAFSDWRAAYVDSTGNVHAVTIDGKTDLTIDRVGDLGIHALNLPPASVSRDGHLLAFESRRGLAVHNLTGSSLGQRVPDIGAESQVIWSPNGAQLILDDNQGAKSVISVADGKLNTSPSSLPTLGPVLGWVDNSHIALVTFGTATAGAATSLTIAVADVTSWALRSVVTMQMSSLTGEWRFSLSPDGKHILYYNKRFRSDPYVPTVKELDVASGAMTSLPGLARAMGTYSGFTSLAWTADSQKIAASTGFDLNNDLKTWILDLRSDKATQLQLPTGRYVAGWAPGTGALILSSGKDSVVDAGPFTVTVVSLGAGSNVTETVLTHQAYTFPFVGFVRTA